MMDENSPSNIPIIVIPDGPESPSLLRNPLLPEWSVDNTETLSGTGSVPYEDADLINDTHHEPRSNYDQVSGPSYEDDNSNLAISINAPFFRHLEDEDTLLISELPSQESNEEIYQEASGLSSFSNVVSKSEETAEEPPTKVRKVGSPNPNNDDTDAESCPICLEPWGNSGDHRLVALKCGHLFGAQCVQRWLRAQHPRERSCPTCKSKATLKDIRFIYAKRLVAVDMSEITTLEKQVDQLQAEKNKTELELEKSRIAHRASVLQLEVLRNTLLKSQISRHQTPKRLWRFAVERNLEISKNGACRVLTYNSRTYEFYVSQKSSNNLFPGFGIRKVSCVDYKLGQFLHLHPKPIRDITYSQPRDLLLSVGLDNRARIVERDIPSAMIQSGVPLWSCSWDHSRSNEFYVGGVGGVIHHYDMRNPGTYIQCFRSDGDFSPVISLRSTEYGLLACQLNSCWLWTTNTRQWEAKPLPVEGPFMSLSYDSDSRRALLSNRASGTERSKLTLCKLRAGVPNSDMLFDIEQTFFGSSRCTFMTRSAYVKAQGSSWVASYSEIDSSLLLHGVDDARLLSLKTPDPVLDICSATLNEDTILAALSESKLRLYKATEFIFN